MSSVTCPVRLVLSDVLSHVPRQIGSLLHECFEWRPPAVVAPDDFSLLLQSLQPTDKFLHLAEVGLVQPLAVELRLPAVLRVELSLCVDPPREVTLCRQEQDGVKLVHDVGPARHPA